LLGRSKKHWSPQAPLLIDLLIRPYLLALAANRKRLIAGLNQNFEFPSLQSIMAALNRGRRSLTSKVIKPAKGLLDADAGDHEENQELASPKMLAEFALANPDAATGLDKEAIPSAAAGALAPHLDVPTVEDADCDDCARLSLAGTLDS
jgi:hypothetical protein